MAAVKPPAKTDISMRVVDLCRLVNRYMPDGDAKKVHDAFLLAEKAHGNVTRKSGELYVTHPLEVARILADLRLDTDTLCAALLHDVIEDTDFDYTYIAKHFGKTVADLVDGVTKLSKKGFKSKQEAGVATFQKMMQAMVKDYRVILIKLADRLHNIRTLGAMSASAQQRIARETLEIHVPLARRMGMNTLRHELQTNAFKSLYPYRSKVLENWWEGCLKRKNATYNGIISTLQVALEHDKRIEYSTVFHWEKNLCRLYEQEKARKAPIRFNRSDITYDIRILTNNTLDCYLALGIVHQLYHPKIGTLKDFISTPKVYGFQALQTVVITHDEEQIRIQIQSKEMYQVAQYGIAAPSRFPYLDQQHNVSISQQRLFKWLEQVKEIQESTGNPLDFLEDMKADFFLSEVSVMTPRGDQKILRCGATPVDFAYAIHTDVGHHCVAARIDGRKAPLNTRLHDGASVEIITDNQSLPHPSWLNFVVTGKARSAIRHWMSTRQEGEFIDLGKQLLDTELQKFNVTFDSISQHEKKELLATLQLANENTLYREVAKGNQGCRLVAQRLLSNTNLETTHTKKTEPPFYIKGAKGLAVQIAECCHPIPDDLIVAHIVHNKGLRIHRCDCTMLMKLSVETKMTTAWEVDDHSTYKVPIQIMAKNQVGVLSAITQAFEQANINIEDINISGDRDKDVRILLKVNNKNQLTRLFKTLRVKPAVTEISRLFNLSSERKI